MEYQTYSVDFRFAQAAYSDITRHIFPTKGSIICMPLVEPLLNLRCRLAPLPSFLWVAIYWIDGYLQILPTIVFLLSVSSLHICSLSYMVIVLIPYTSSAYGKEVHPVGKSYAFKVEAEKTAFEQRSKHRQNRHKKPATSILAAIADMGG